MATYTVTVDGDISAKDSTKIQQALQKSLGKWFKKGHAIKVEEA